MLKKNYYTFFTLLPYLWLVTGMLVYKSSDKAMLVIIIFSMISTYLHQGMSTLKENALHNRSYWVVILVAIYAVFQYFYHGISNREVCSLVGSALLLITFPRSLLTQKLLNQLALIGSIVCFLYTLYYAEYLEIARSRWSINAIPYATLTAVFGVIALSQLTEKCNKFLKACSFFVLILTIFTLAINETRGVLFAFLVVTLYFLITAIKQREIKAKQIIFSLFALTVVALFTKPLLEPRYRSTLQEIQHLQKGNQATSIGLRLQMWQSTPHMIQDNYILYD